MKIAIVGYGKMGHMIESIALERGHEIVGAIEPMLQSAESRLPIIDFDSDAFRSADVAIEFTTPATAAANVRAAWAQGVPVVCGSTGWKPETLTDSEHTLHTEGNKVILKNKDGKTMLVWSSNYSIGVNIFFDTNRFLAQQMAIQSQYAVALTETHHIHKLDKPSGTAKTLAEQISAAYGSDMHQDIPIESIREGEVPGTHVVSWDSEEDTIIITHIAKGRRGFALGAVVAAEKVCNL